MFLWHNDGVSLLAQLEHLLVGIDVLPLLQSNPPLLLLGQIQVRAAKQTVNEALQNVPT